MNSDRAKNFFICIVIIAGCLAIFFHNKFRGEKIFELKQEGNSAQQEQVLGDKGDLYITASVNDDSHVMVTVGYDTKSKVYLAQSPFDSQEVFYQINGKNVERNDIPNYSKFDRIKYWT